MKKTIVQELEEAYKDSGHETTKALLDEREAQHKRAEEELDKLAAQGNPLALLIKGFKEQGKQNDKSNETHIDFYKGNDDGHNMKVE